MEETNQNQNKAIKTRTQRIEEFLLDPDKMVFESIEELQSAVSSLLEIFSAIDVEQLEMLKGQDGKTPKKGVDYFTAEEVAGLEAFIISKIPQVGVDLPSRIQVETFIRNEIAKIPVIKGEDGAPGRPGTPGRNGSPDTGDQIIAKIRSVGKNQGLKIKDIRGLENTLKEIIAEVDTIAELKKRLDEHKIVIPALGPGSGEGSGEAGTDGNTVLSGAGAPSDVLGVDGDFYINTTDYDIYGPKTAGAWGSATSLIGPGGYSLPTLDNEGMVFFNGTDLETDTDSLSRDTTTGIIRFNRSMDVGSQTEQTIFEYGIETTNEGTLLPFKLVSLGQGFAFKDALGNFLPITTSAVNGATQIEVIGGFTVNPTGTSGVDRADMTQTYLDIAAGYFYADMGIPILPSYPTSWDGQFGIESGTADFLGGLLKYYSGQEFGVIAMPITEFTTPTKGVVEYDPAADSFGLLPIDLSAIEARVNSLDAAVVLMGGWDASAGTFPGAGSAQAGASYIVTVAGTVDGVEFNINDRIVAILDNASAATYASNWLKLDYTDQVLLVAGLSGNISKAALQSALDISNVNTGDETVTTLGAKIGAATDKATPVDADYLGLMDSAASSVLKKLSWANVKATLKTYFDSVTTTLTNKTIVKRVVALTDAATIAINADNLDIGTVTLAGNRTLGAPTGTPVDGQMMEIRVRQDATGSRTLAYNAIYRFGTDVTSPTLTTTAAKTDYLLFQYNSTDTKWDCLAVSKGY